MASDPRPPCLSCGQPMNVANTTAPGGDLKSFERQRLVCPNCGDTDSRFVFTSADVKHRSDATVDSPALIAAEEQISAEHLVDPPSAPSVLDAFLAHTGPHMVSHSEPRTPSAADPHPAGPPADENAAMLVNNKFSELLQTYLAKWRQS